MNFQGHSHPQCLPGVDNKQIFFASDKLNASLLSRHCFDRAWSIAGIGEID